MASMTRDDRLREAHQELTFAKAYRETLYSLKNQPPGNDLWKDEHAAAVPEVLAEASRQVIRLEAEIKVLEGMGSGAQVPSRRP